MIYSRHQGCSKWVPFSLDLSICPLFSCELVAFFGALDISSVFCSRFGHCALYKQEKTLVSITSTVRSVCIAFLAIFSAFE